MVKKAKQKVIQMLSPENYIRQKGRLLPIYECMVNANWDKSQIANVWIARRHSNGNITACIYLVDLLCLGIKDSTFFFNMQADEYLYKTDKFKELAFGKNISYTLAHNIVYAGIEFANDYGFQPHKKFTNVTRHFLEDDTDDIELIEIECGKDGRPVVFPGPYDNDLKIQGIIKKIEKTAGIGNFHVIDPNEIEDDYEDIPDEADDEEDEGVSDDNDEFDNLSLEEKENAFRDLYHNQPKEESKDYIFRLIQLTDSILYDLMDPEIYKGFYTMISNELNIDIEYDEIPDKFFVEEEVNIQVPQDFKDIYLYVYNLVNEDDKQAYKEWKLFNKAQKKLSSVMFLELLILRTRKSKKYTKLTQEYARIYPDYPLIKLARVTNQILSGEVPEKFPEYPFKLSTFFPGRKSIHPIERTEYLLLWFILLNVQADLSRLLGLYDALDDLELSEGETIGLKTMINLIKLTIITSKLIDNN